MVNIVRFPREPSAQEEAAHWVARLDRGLSGDERAELGRWLKVDARHREALLELAEMWDELNVLGELSELFPLEQPAPRKQGRAVRWAVAASIGCLAAILGFVAFEARNVEEFPAAEIVSQAFQTSVGGRASERLPDGSLVQLNTDTEIAVEYTSDGRDIVMQRGEAHFDVAQDVSRPFSVRVGERVVQAVGTAFNVKLGREGTVEVMVTEGEVKVGRLEPVSVRDVVRPLPERPRFDTTLVEGEIALLERSAAQPGAGAQVMRLEPIEIDNKLAWQRGMLAFQGGEPLGSVLEEVARYTTTEFVLEDENLRDVRVGGYFRADDIDGLLITLRNTFDIDSERVGDDRIVLRPAQ